MAITSPISADTWLLELNSVAQHSTSLQIVEVVCSRNRWSCNICLRRSQQASLEDEGREVLTLAPWLDVPSKCIHNQKKPRTGVSGKDGAYVAKLLLENGHEVCGTSRDAQISAFRNLDRFGIRKGVQLASVALNDFRSVLQVLLKAWVGRQDARGSFRKIGSD